MVFFSPGSGLFGQSINQRLGFSDAERTGIFRPAVLSANGDRPQRWAFGEYDFMDAPDYRPSGDPKENHKTGETFARVYANLAAAPAMTHGNKIFPAGSIIVREKLWRADSAEPALVTAMIKRERGFSPRTNDWEFFVIDRGLKRVKDRDTVGNCAACHVNAKEADWVYKTYLP